MSALGIATISWLLDIALILELVAGLSSMESLLLSDGGQVQSSIPVSTWSDI
jgi:hypothetical protein